MAYYKASYVTDYKEYFSLKPDYDTEAMEVYVYTTSINLQFFIILLMLYLALAQY